MHIETSKYKRLTTILVKPAGPDCNMQCEYCFYLEKKDIFPETNTHRVNLFLLENLIKQLSEQTDGPASVVFQGGEPLLMGLDFYQKAEEYKRKWYNGNKLEFAIQTNGTLINNDWAQFFSKYKWLVGLSVDGPEHIHNHYRKNKSGRGSWQKVSDVAELLLKKGVAVNAMCCITDYSAQYAKELYSWFKQKGLTWMQFIPIFEKEDVSNKPFSVLPEQYGQFLIQLFDLWYGDFKNGMPTTSIRYFDSVFHTYVGMESPECTMNQTCGNYLVVEYNGNVYSCDFFVDPHHQLGNIQNEKLIDLLNSSAQQNFGGSKKILPDGCAGCPWLPRCYGDCLKNRTAQKGQVQSYFCKSYKMFFEHADERLKSLASYWKMRHS